MVDLVTLGGKKVPKRLRRLTTFERLGLLTFSINHANLLASPMPCVALLERASPGSHPPATTGCAACVGARHRLRCLRIMGSVEFALLVLLLPLTRLVVLHQAPALVDQRRKVARHFLRESFVLV